HGQQPLIRQLTWDKAGRLSAMQWAGLESGGNRTDMLDSLPGGLALNSHSIANPTRPPQAMVGALASKHYHYDSLGQMVGIQTPMGMSRFAYDAAGRLTGSETPQAGVQRWQFDPAGNRSPITGPTTAPTASEAITGELNETDRTRAQQRASNNASPVSKEQIGHSDFNALQGKEANGHNPQATQKWAGNRVAYYENREDASSEGARIHYQYDSRGNRIACAEHSPAYHAYNAKHSSNYSHDLSQADRATASAFTQLHYDAGNQLVQVVVRDASSAPLIQRYRYDAFGRRLAKYRQDAAQAAKARREGTPPAAQVDYFGWDGDRLVHTERFNSTNPVDDSGAPQPEVIHTLYEPGSFTPLVQLRRASKAPPTMADELLGHMRSQPGLVQDALRGFLTEFSSTQKLIESKLGTLGMDEGAQSFIREQMQGYAQLVQSQETESAKAIALSYYLCDHLGTPQALVSAQGAGEWAAQLDAWGHVMAEYNPHNRYQPIRLPGQHEDEDTGLYYNHHRYYDSVVGRYINQDPIGLEGGVNKFLYSISDPVNLTDATGLEPKLEEARKESEKLKQSKDAVQGAKKIKDGANKVKNSHDKRYDIGSCVLEPTTCKMTGEEMQMKYDQSKKELKDGYKDIANGSVSVYENTPGTLGNGGRPIK
ncbi:MAG: RHS repeat-associated core domain-containing protein, partial [Comamonas sp.]